MTFSLYSLYFLAIPNIRLYVLVTVLCVPPPSSAINLLTCTGLRVYDYVHVYLFVLTVLTVFKETKCMVPFSKN